MAYTFDNLFAADPSNPTNVASNASILLYDPADPTKAPVTITDPTGSPIPNPVTVNKNGFGPAMQHATLDRLAWEGGGFSNFITSYEGIKNEAVSARTAAQNAAATAGADAVVRLDELIAAGEFKGEKGADGSNVLPTNDAVAQAITTEGPTKTALSAKIATGIVDSPVVSAKLEKADAEVSRHVRSNRLVQGMLTAPVMSTPPTLTYSSSLFAGYVAGATNSTSGWPNNTAIRPSGAPLAPPNEFSATYPLGPDSQLTIFDGSVHFDFDCPDATFVFRTQITSTGRFRIWVDGQPHAASPVLLSTLSAVSGSPGYIKVDFGSRSTARRVSIELEGVKPNATGTPLPFYGVWKEAAGSIWPTSISSARMVVLGDSYAKGIGAAVAADAYPVQLGRLLGITDTHHFTAVSSTGIMKGTTTNSYRTRLQKIIDAKPDIVLFQGSINDADSWPLYQGQIGPQFKLDIATLRAGLPNAIIIVTSPLEVRVATAAELAVRDELKTAVAEVGLPFIDILGTQFFNGTGKVGATNGTGNADYFVAPTADDSSGAHPSSAGHLAIAKLLAGKIAPLIGATSA